MRSKHHARQTERTPLRRAGARLLLVVLAALASALAAPTPAHAQPELWATSPEDGAVLDAAPGEIAVIYSDALDATGSALTLTGPDQAPIELEPPRVDDTVLIQPMRYTDLGAYTVTVDAVFADGQTVQTTFSFSVEAVDAMLAVGGDPIDADAEADAGTEDDAAPAAESSGSNLVLGAAALAAVLVIAGGIPLIRRLDRRRRSHQDA
ncbi:hypothetical protein GCM10009830_00410 [Glycomyces endophyticus]|uniref:CopC domain-containing protein n=1 Tax=Glycomyces endophyticus TaxID=480996 RepID=A0ABP4RPT6_9ACTN